MTDACELRQRLVFPRPGCELKVSAAEQRSFGAIAETAGSG